MTLTLTLLGTGTSHGVPEIACHCAVCKSENPRNKRLRTSAWVRDETRSILIDASADFRQQALKYDLNRLDAILLTHTHHDHIGGLDDVRALNVTSGRIPVYILNSEAASLERSYYYFFEPLRQLGGGIPNIELIKIGELHRFDVAGIPIQPILAFHGAVHVLGYRIFNVAYLTDVKTLPEETLQQLHGLDHLVINSLRYRHHTTHMNLAETLSVIEQLAPKRAYLTHTTHDFDYDRVNAELPAGVELAYDGLEIEVT